MRFLYNAPAIFHKGALIVGDTHFGMESKLRRKGIFDEQFSVRLASRLKELVLETKAKKLILLGDVKEDITMLDSTTEHILASLSMACELVIVKGNHDGGIERCGNAEIAGAGGMVHEGIGLIHGHSWPDAELMECDYLISGHQHPMVEVSDAFGKVRREAAWLIAPPVRPALMKKYKEANPRIKLILMPAFNPLVGSAIKYDEKERLGPILNNKLFKLDDALVIRLSGTRLGKLNELSEATI